MLGQYQSQLTNTNKSYKPLSSLWYMNLGSEGELKEMAKHMEDLFTSIVKRTEVQSFSRTYPRDHDVGLHTVLK